MANEYVLSLYLILLILCNSIQNGTSISYNPTLTRTFHCCFKATTNKSFKRTSLSCVLSSKKDDEGDKNQRSKITEKQYELFRQLDEKFDYEGRLPTMASPSKNLYQYRCGFVGIVGLPNVGKSTLLNALIRESLCISTSRPQTTRHSILGLLSSTVSQCQVCLLDSPGIINDPSYKLQEGMMEAVKGVVDDSDSMVVVTDPFTCPNVEEDGLFQRVRGFCEKDDGGPVVVVLNKADLAKVRKKREQGEGEGEGEGDGKDPNIVMQEKQHDTIDEAVLRWRELLPNALAIIPTCAAKGEDDVGVNALRQILLGGPDVPRFIRHLGRPIPGMFREGVKMISDEMAREILPVGPPLYGADELTDRTERFFASELIRSTIFETLGKEVPYCCDVRVTDFKEPKIIEDQNNNKKNNNKQLIRMAATINVERSSQKGIVIGKNGRQIKEIGTKSRLKLEDFFQNRVHLDLSVKVDENWRKDEAKLKSYGYMK